ncbi:MAG: GTPase/DUF3482 domain-containing protein [Halothiobacillaceae bacterium]
MRPLQLAVVGHTNTGKTSLLRTLTRDIHFGKVSAKPSATRHVEGARLLADDEAIIELYDTPGLEDALNLLDAIDALIAPNERLDGPARIARFLASKDAKQRFEQEAKVLRQLLASDAGLVVIDVRDPVLAKYRDELSILADCGKPLLPILNFVHTPNNHAEAWREALARIGLHSVISFDTVTPEIDGEQRLFAKLALMLDAHAPALQRLILARQREAEARLQAAAQALASLLIDVAAYRISVPHTDEAALQAPMRQLQEKIRQREAACVQELLKLYRFRHDDVTLDGLPMLDGRWEDDLFSPDALKKMGINLSQGLVAGAVAGVSIDLIVGGLTLGAATVAGALAGGLWQLGNTYGERVLGKLRGYRSLTVDDTILRLLALRQLTLVQALQQRGHAAMHAIEPKAQLDTTQAKTWREKSLPGGLKKARSHEEWSAMNPEFQTSEAREQQVQTLAELLVREG